MDTPPNPSHKASAPPTGQAAIRTESLCFSYGSRPVLDHVTLTAHPGEVVCLLGPNGVGKTTLVENLIGSLTPTSGTVRVLGEDPRRAGAGLWRRLGLVQQHWTDHGRWRVIDQLSWVRDILLTEGGPVRPAREALAEVGLEGVAGTRLSRLSGGQRRAVDLATALLADPALLLLDEPTTGLDPASKARTHDLLLERADSSTTILMTTHDLSEAERIASRVLVMSRGRVVADGTVPQLRERLTADAEVTWVEDGTRHVHATPAPEQFVSTLDAGRISNLAISRASLEEVYLSLVGPPAGSPADAPADSPDSPSDSFPDGSARPAATSQPSPFPAKEQP